MVYIKKSFGKERFFFAFWEYFQYTAINLFFFDAMNAYADIYEPINWTRLILLIVLMCTSIFYYSTQMFVVEASDISTEGERNEIYKQSGMVDEIEGIDEKSNNK